jgi:hypothetical protein
MSPSAEFRSLVEGVIRAHPDTSIAARWQDASLPKSATPIAHWVRDTTDLVNIVWLFEGTIFDVTWFPDREMSTLSVLPRQSIIGVEIRQVTGVGARFGLPVSGNLAVTVQAPTERASLLWIASDEPSNEQALRAFALRIRSADF